ncbi:MAG: glycoside hydrolase family 43 protein [Acholeplasmataceae bacterium]
MKTFQNPIIPGFYPDPSIVRVDDDYYLVNSSFEYFPAIPIWHSKDLVHWKQIGHAIDREEQGLDLSKVNPSGGVQAATIRYHQGMYYISSTRVNPEWPKLNYHFIVTAKNPKGPWSACHFIEDAPGIDSALFFEDNRAYFLANDAKEVYDRGSETHIWIQEMDVKNMRLIGEKHILWDGTGGVFAEGPRLYKKDGMYYLLIAEGGTLHHHATTVASSKHIFGPYQPSRRNPLLTHRHLSRAYPIQNVGHTDLVQTQHGDWFAVCLGSRPKGGFYDGGNTIHSFGGYYRNLGRETFLIPVIWPHDDEGPLLSPDTGKVELSYPFPRIESARIEDSPVDFSKQALTLKWNSAFKDDRNHIQRLSDTSIVFTLQHNLKASFFGTRQTSWSVDQKITFHLDALASNDWIGFVSYIKPTTFFGVKCIKEDTYKAMFYEIIDGVETVFDTYQIKENITIRLMAETQDYSYIINTLDGEKQFTFDGRNISCDLNDAHTGVFQAFVGASNKQSQIIIDYP